MATRAATFTAKIRTLYDYHFRAFHNFLPLPSGIDIANTLKYFSQTLLGVLRDVPTIPLEIMQFKEQDDARMSMFPSLDYKGFFNAVVQLVDVVPLIHYGATALGQAILHSLACLVPFLEHEYMDTLPYLVASCMAIFSSTLHKDIMDLLCNNLLPFTIVTTSNWESQNYATSSAAAICMLIFQYSEQTAHHCQLLECLMSLKADVLRDILCVIANGTSSARAPAANLLFYYWPSLNPALHDRRGIHLKFTGWEPLVCQRENCLSPENNEAVKMCLDHSIAIGSGDHPPPLYICYDCAEQIRRDQPACLMKDILLPLQQISITCENKNCRSSDKTAISTCFSIECASYNGNRPIRYCAQCHSIRHNNRRGVDHIFHTNVNTPWLMDLEMQGFLVEAIVSLLKEAQPMADRRVKDLDECHLRVDSDINQSDSGILEERRLLSRYGVYLLVGLCTPNEETSVETLGRLLGMLFQWFDTLAYLPDDQAGNTLERLKSEYIHGWLMDVCHSHFEVFVSCLLPHPVEYARVGGHWDTLVNRTSHIKEGFNRLFCLVPYEIISLEVWDYIMPHWMEAIRCEVPEEELIELKILLSKVLDPEMSPLGFDAHQMYRFISIRFQNTRPPVQEQALFWLQILSMLNVVIPLSLLFSMFNDGVKACSSSSTDQLPEGPRVLHSSRDDFTTSSIIGIGLEGEDSRTNSPFSSDDQPLLHILGFKLDEEVRLPCFVLMLDILLKQLELQEVDPHQGVEHIVSRESLALIENMICAPWSGSHTCKDNTTHDCIICELATTFYQLSLEIIDYISPVMETCKTDITTDGEVVGSDDSSRRGSPSDDLSQKPLSQMVDLPASPPEQDEGPDICIPQLFTATVQTVFDTELDTVAIMPTEEVMKAVARAVTLTETDVGLAKVSVALPAVVGEGNRTAAKDAEDDGTFWHTSQGKFKFTLEELSPQLQLIYKLLKELAKYDCADVLYHILCCLKFLCLHAECLTLAAKEFRGFLIWCQENIIIASLWQMLQAEYSHISQVCVQILSHCITLPMGADVFWKIIEDNFHNTEWTVRSSAVEKVTMIARFVEKEPVKQSQSLQSSLANAFCYLISSIDDVHPTVAQKAMLCLETIKDSSLKCLCWCLEVQFDTIIVDRPMILQTVFQLYTRLNDRKILSWEFFLNRFDALFLEAQVNLERSGDIAYLRDLKNTDMNSEVFVRKLHRAQEALSLSHSESVRSLSMSLGAKLRYKRTMSAPGGMIARQEKIGKNKEVDKEKLFSRQSSAPVLKRKCSKFGIAQVVGQLPNHLFQDANLKEPQQEENNFLAMLHRVMEMEDSDKDTMHLLIFLFMQFLSRPDHAYPSDEKAIAKVQTVVLRHLNVLLGYNAQDKGFCIPPHHLRSSPVFNTFLFSLPSVLDQNFKMGTLILATCLPLLQYCPSPQRCSSEIQQPSYSLWYLEPYARHSWLMSVLTFIYKYRYSALPLSRQVQGLIHIILNTLEAQDHRCHRLPNGCLLTTPNTSRSRDLSTVSMGEGPCSQERDCTPPHSPGISSDNTRITISFPTDVKVVYQKSEVQDEVDTSKFSDSFSPDAGKVADRADWVQPWKPRKMTDFSFSSDAEDGEPELEAIPESPKSEGTVHESSEDLSNERMESAIMETAVAYIEPGLNFDDSILVINPPLNTSLKVMPVATSSGPVESQMVHQIEAFHESFDKDKKDESFDAQDSVLGLDSVNSLKNNVASVKLASEKPDDAEHNLVKNTNHASLRAAHSFCYPSNKSLEPSSSAQPTLHLPEVNTEKLSHAIMKEPKAAPKLQRSATLDCGTLTPAKLESGMKNLQVLDARQLEQSIRRRQPTVISQSEQPSPYLFQPIQAHPITNQISDSTDKYNSDVKLAQPIKVEPLRSPINETGDAINSPVQVVNAAAIPWTIEVHSPIQLEPLPRPERLLSIGQTSKLPENRVDGQIEENAEQEMLKTRDVDVKDLKGSRGVRPVPVRSIVVQPLSGQIIKEGPHPGMFHIEPVMIAEKPPLNRCELSRKTSWKKDPKTRSLFKYNIGSPHLMEESELAEVSTTNNGMENFSRDLVPSALNANSVTNGKHMADELGDLETITISLAKGDEKISVEKYCPAASISDCEKAEKSIRKNSHAFPINGQLSHAKMNMVHEHVINMKHVTAQVDSHVVVVDQPETFKENICSATMESMDSITNVVKEMAEEPMDEFTRILQPSLKRLTKQNPITDVDLQHQSSGSTDAQSIDGPDDEYGVAGSQHIVQDHDDHKGRPHFRQRRQRKIGISSTDMQKLIDQHNNLNRKSKKDPASQTHPQRSNLKPSSLRCGEETVVEKCPECGAILEQYSDEELALCIVILATYIHREPALAAPSLPEILRTVARIASCTTYAWQQENNIYLPGSASSVAKQFIRCVLHQLAPNGIFMQLFQSSIDDSDFFKTIASALTDFNELNPSAPLQLLLEGLNDCKILPVGQIQQITYNIASYMMCLSLETASSTWSNIIPQFDIFFRKLYLILSGQVLDLQPIFQIMISILKIPGLHSFKSILDPFSKMLSYAIQNCNLVYQHLLELCHLCNRAFTKERDKLLLSRTVVFELVQSLKFKANISDDNLLMLVQFVVQDAGGTLGPSIIIEDEVPHVSDIQNLINTSACECMRQNLNDALDFVADVHTLSKVKSNFKGTMVGLNEDTLGATLKAGIAQYLALEITRGNSRDNRAISRYLPWLCNPPSAVQQGPKEFLDCVAHIRLLSWLLLGALTHSAMLGCNSSLVCQPIPLEASCHVADHIQVILTGFAEQSKASVLHMSSLFHAFILCQLWTMYCEQMASLDPPGSEHHNAASITLTDFWAKITPSILQLLSHSKVLAEMVNLHFLSLMEALLECNSTVLSKVFPLWSPVLYAYQGQLPGHMQVRLQMCEDKNPPTQTKDEVSSSTHTLLKWLQRLQFKMGQIELQSSAATQFYSV